MKEKISKTRIRLLKKKIDRKAHLIRKGYYDTNFWGSGCNVEVIEKEELFEILDEFLKIDD